MRHASHFSLSRPVEDGAADTMGPDQHRARAAGAAFALRYGGRLELAGRRLGADAHALSVALCDMMRDGDLSPAAWPIDDMLAVLRAGAARPCRQLGKVIDALERVRARALADDAAGFEAAA